MPLHKLTMIITLLSTSLMLMPHSAYANYNINKVGDWKYRSYVCETATTYLVFFSSIEIEGKPESIIDTDNEEAEAEKFVVEDIQKQKPAIIKSTFSFDKGDAQWIGLMTTTVRDALSLMYPDKRLDALTINRYGFDMCIGMFDKMDDRIKGSMK